VIVDQRDPGPGSKSGSPGNGQPSADARGDALFDWDGSLHMDRSAGLMEMHRNVRMTHRALKDHDITNLVCDDLSATAKAPEQGRGVALRSATATGAVYATSGPEAIPGETPPPRKELVADRAQYDAVARVITATARHGGRVTFFDPAKGTPASAAGITWDLVRDRIEITRPGAVVGPR
jgi:hypothetical protein